MSDPYSEIAQTAIKAIGESKSNLAYPVLVWLNENLEDLKIKSNVQKSLSLLKLSGVKTDITKEYYKRLLSLSPVHKCYINFPDGHGNIGIIFSRKNEAEFIQMFALVLNDTDGIVDCFGFNEISDAEFERIVNKFYQNNKVLEITPEFCKFLMENAEKISRLQFTSVSYEYIAWKSVTNDIDYIDIDLRSNLKKIELNEFLMKQIYEQGYFDKWFFTQNDNEAFAQMMKVIAGQKICDISKIETLIDENKSLIFNQTYSSLLEKRLILSAYLALTDDEKTASDIIYSLTDESIVKEDFLTDYIKKSVYQHFLSQKDKYNSLKNATSIFARKLNKELHEIDIKYIEGCIKEIEKHWIQNV